MTTPARRLSLLLGIGALLATACSQGSSATSAFGITPPSSEVAPGGSVAFAATGLGADPVAWSIVEPEGGTIDPTGHYTAPDLEGTFHVQAAVASLSAVRVAAVSVKRVHVAVSPTSATLAPGQSLTLTATVTGAVKTVTWSVTEGPAGGTVSADGVYTAPAAAGVYHVVAASTANPLQSDGATVTVTAPPPPPPPAAVAISVSPQSASIVAGGTVQLTAAVTGSTDVGVTWSVTPAGGGTVSPTGLYASPAAAGTYDVVATSNADPSKTAPAVITVTAATAPPTAAGAQLFVAPGGSDSNPGTEALPFATLERARSAVSQLKQASGLPANGVVVWLRDGVYDRTTPFTLGSGDSGAAGAPVVYKAYPGETPRLAGGKVLQPAWWSLVSSGDARWSRLPAAARGNVYKVNLAAHGITGYGALTVRGGGYTPNPNEVNTTELFFNGVPATLARWPNVGDSATNVRGGMALTSGATDTTHLQFYGTRPSAWGAALAANEVWLHAWGISYSDLHVLVTAVNGNTFTVSRNDGTANGFFYAPPAGAPYYAENVLEELDTPGEWWMDRSGGDLYYWPTAPLAAGEAIVSTNTGRLVEVSGASYVTFDGVTFEAGRNQLVRIDSGTNVTLTRCRLRNAGSIGVAVMGGSQNGIDYSEVTGTGEQGVWLAGSSNFLTNSDLHHTARWSWNEMPAVELHGTGNRVAHDHIHHLPDQGVWFYGGSHVMEYNDVHDTTQYSSDAGAIYANGRLGQANGNELRFNYVHDVRSWFNANEHGIYLDDGYSGVHVHGNVVRRIDGLGILHGGGQNDVFESNIIESTGRAAYRADNRASWPGVGFTPTGSVFSRNLLGLNVGYAAGGANTNGWIDVVVPYFAQEIDNIPQPPTGYSGGGADPQWVDPSDVTKGLQATSPVNTIPGWQPIPFSGIGIGR